MILVATATALETTWLVEHDQNITPEWVVRCLQAGEYLVAEIDGQPVGYLRFSWFWRAIPYMERIHVLEARRRSGIGTALVGGWEADMRQAGAAVLMTSSTSYELEPQTWHRRNGFVESGSLTFGAAEPTPEVFLVKDL